MTANIAPNMTAKIAPNMTANMTPYINTILCFMVFVFISLVVLNSYRINIFKGKLQAHKYYDNGGHTHSMDNTFEHSLTMTKVDAPSTNGGPSSTKGQRVGRPMQQFDSIPPELLESKSISSRFLSTTDVEEENDININGVVDEIDELNHKLYKLQSQLNSITYKKYDDD